MKKEKIWKRSILLVLFACVLVFQNGAIVFAAEAGNTVKIQKGQVYRNGKAYTGWYTQKSSKYYAAKGKRIKGWKQISHQYYYFENDYKLAVNKIAGTSKSGYYYVDKSGIRVTTTEIRNAVTFVLKNSNAKASNSVRLQQCVNALCRYPYRHMSTQAPKAGNLASYARYMFQNRSGNCYRYAAAMAYIGRVLGYDSRVTAGGVTARGQYAALSPHGWCELRMGNAWRIVDCSMQRVYGAKLYLVTRKTYPYRLRCDKTYILTVSSGKVKWA